MSTGIVHRQTPEEEELARKLAELAVLEAELAERELELATSLGELHLFERRYMRVVGARYATIEGAHHATPMMKPAALIPSVLSFLDAARP